jgi:ribosomal-protein-alanine N-acetyltransferase
MVIPERVETQRLLLTRLQLTDAEEIFYTYASKPESTRFVSWPIHESISATRQFLLYARQAWAEGLDFSFSIRLKGTNRLIGACGFLNDGGKTQIGYVLGPLHWNSGYATESTQKVVQLLRAQPDVVKINSFVDADNHASARVLQKCGFVAEAMLKGVVEIPQSKLSS